MELYQLKTFVAVARLGHLTRASRELNLSQPSVSAHIKALEEELGLKLFVRGPKGMELTSEGAALLTKARQTLQAAEEMIHFATGLHENLRGEIALALQAEASSLKISELADSMAARHPGLVLDLRRSTSNRIKRDVIAGELDAGFVYGPADEPELHSLLLAKVQVRVVAPLKFRERILRADWAELAEMPWIWGGSEECPFYCFVMQQFQERGLAPSMVSLTDQEAIIKELVKGGVGLSVLLEREAGCEADAGNLVVWDKVRGEVSLQFVISRERESQPRLAALSCAVRELWEQ